MEVKFKVFEKPVLSKCTIHSSKEVFDYLYQYSKADRELFIIIFLNSKNYIIDDEIHTAGQVDSSGVFPKQVFRSALIHNASSLILAHNHPSGDPEPSRQDREITKQLVNAGLLLDCRILDHIIIGDNRYFSFADDGLIGDCERQSSILSSSHREKTPAEQLSF